jgi:tetratricopeptide (TPR) repeat protein
MTVILFTRQAVIGLIASISLLLAFQPQVADATEKMPFSLEDVLEWRQLGSPAERADVMIGLGNHEAAVQLLKQWQPTNPTDWVALHRSIAHVFQAIGQPEKALAYLEDAQTLLEHKDRVTWRSLIDVQLTSRHWSAAEKSLSDPQFAALASTKERRAWRELLNALRSVDQLVDWRRALEAWQALAVDSPAMLPIARHLIGAQQGEVIDHFLSKDDAQKRSPQWATVVALRAHQNGHTDT